MSERRARRFAGWTVLLGGLVGALLSLLTAQAEQRLVFDGWQRLSPREVSADNVAVVLIDNLSLDAVGPWPWSRYYVARLTESIAQAQPAVIGFDIVFAESDALDPAIFAALYPELDAGAAQQVADLPSMDLVLAQVFGMAPVVLARVAVNHDGSDPALVMVDPPVIGQPPRGALKAPAVLASIPQIDDVALGHAVVNGPEDSDGIVRRVPLSAIAGNTVMPGFAAELVRIASGAPQLEWQGQTLRLGDLSLPADGTASLPLRFGGVSERAVYSAAEVLGGKVAPEAFAGKVVLVGLGAEGTADIVATPLGTTVFGILVQAQAVDAMLTGGWLARPGWAIWAEFGAGFVLVILVFLAAANRRYWLLAPAALLAIALPAVSWLAFDAGNLLIDPARPLLAGLGAALAMWAMLHAAARAERERLAHELVEQRVEAAQQEGELKAARRIQLGMVPALDALARLDSRVEIGAVLQPARSVGGDFYDAMMIAPDRMLMIVGDVTGKGVPAALFMVLSKALSKTALSHADEDFGRAVAALNRDLMSEADEEMGVTMLIGVLDCASGELALVNAGHENPLVVRADGRVETLAMKGGPPFCVIDFPYAAERFALNEGDTLVLITDGATEAQNADRRLFGTEGVIAALNAEGSMGAPARAADLAARVRAYEGETEPSDDLTIMALRYAGPDI